MRGWATNLFTMWKRLGLGGMLLLGCQPVAPTKTSVMPKTARPVAATSSQAPPLVSLPVTPAGAAAELTGARPAPAEEPFVTIAAALWSTCGLLQSGNVWCWGEAHGSSSSDEWQAIRQMPLSNVTRLLGSRERFFALTSSGAAYVWGRQRLSPNGERSSALPVALPLGPVLDIAASWDAFCTLERSGRIACWDSEGASTELALLPSAQSLALSTRMTCAKLASGQVSCFGEGTQPAVRPGLSNVVELVAGGSQHCARQSDGSVSCWPDAAPAELAGKATRLTATPNAVCAFKASGPPVCQRLASGGDRDQPVLLPAQVFSASTTVQDVSLGPRHGCAVVSSRPWCWGEGLFGELGPAGKAWNRAQISKQLHDDPSASEQVLARISLGDTAALRQVDDVAVSPSHQCIITLDGTLRCWGNNDWGQLGVDPRAPAFGIMRATDLKRVERLAITETTSCAIAGGELYCWGRQPWRSELAPCRTDGDAPAPCSATPSRLATDVVQVGLGRDFGCLLDRDYAAHCWGVNASGQLGNGTTTPSSTPVRVLGEDGKPLGAVARLRVFESHACAIGMTGKLWCWGNNAPLAQGRRYNSPLRLTRATAFPALPAVRDVSDRCVLGPAHELRCWGDVFDDRRHFSYEPVQVGHCGVTQLVSGPGRCFADSTGLSCLDWQVFEGDSWYNAAFRSEHPAKRLAGAIGQVCAVDEQSRLSCFRYDSFHYQPVIGEQAGSLSLQDTVTPGCARDKPPTSLPFFPPVPPASVTIAESLDHFSERPATPPPSKKLSPGQVARLLRLLNDRSQYTNMSTCHDPLFEFTLRDAKGESQGEVSVGSCSTLEVSPEVPAQHGRGNVFELPLSHGLRQICLETGLGACNEEPP